MEREVSGLRLPTLRSDILSCVNHGFPFMGLSFITCIDLLTPRSLTLVPTCAQGADTVIYERMAHHDPQNMQLKEPTTKHMEEYGSAGLRTLCLAYAELQPDFYNE